MQQESGTPIIDSISRIAHFSGMAGAFCFSIGLLVPGTKYRELFRKVPSMILDI
jgi:hypothetical protein